VINGGLPACESFGFPIEEGDPQPVLSPANEQYPNAAVDPSKIRGYAHIVANASKQFSSFDTELVLDARSQGRWAGKDPEPRPNLRSGHIPNSLSVPFSILLESNFTPKKNLEYTTLMSPKKLEDVLRSALGDERFTQVMEGKRTVINSCGSGMSATIIWLALRILGVESAIYDESWSGYALREESKIGIA